MKAQMKFQRAVTLLALIVCALCFIYALSFMTGMYDLLFQLSKEGGKPKVAGANLFYDFQPFNKEFVKLALACLVCSLLPIITLTGKRRKYYVSNYVAIGINVLANSAMSVWLFSNVTTLKKIYVETVDWEKLKEMTEGVIYNQIKYTESTIWFDLGFVAVALLTVASLAMIANLIWKIQLIRRENKLLIPKQGEVL